MADLTDAGELVRVSREQAARLRDENPKGKLLELCMRHRVLAPEFEAAAHLEGHARRGALRTEPGEPLWSRWFLGLTVKEAEQAACVELLELLQRWIEGEGPELAEPPEPRAGAPAKNPRMRLNELKQAREIDEFGFELLDQRGPPHAPVFSARCWVQRGGQRHHGPPFEARSKREAEGLAAADMVPLVEPLAAAD